jgi:hypothetical protein
MNRTASVGIQPASETSDEPADDDDDDDDGRKVMNNKPCQEKHMQLV